MWHYWGSHLFVSNFRGSWNKHLKLIYLADFVLIDFTCCIDKFFLEVFRKNKSNQNFQKSCWLWNSWVWISGQGVIALSTSKEVDSSELQKRIAENEEAIKNKKKNAKSNGKMEKAKNVDYSPSGNSQKVSDKGLFCLGDSVMMSAINYTRFYPDATVDALF